MPCYVPDQATSRGPLTHPPRLFAHEEVQAETRKPGLTENPEHLPPGRVDASHENAAPCIPPGDSRPRFQTAIRQKKWPACARDVPGGTDQQPELERWRHSWPPRSPPGCAATSVR